MPRPGSKEQRGLSHRGRRKAELGDNAEVAPSPTPASPIKVGVICCISRHDLARRGDDFERSRNAGKPCPIDHAAILVGVDLGPNLSVTGSLATILWLSALKREGIKVSSWSFLKLGFLVMPPALLLAVASTIIL